MAMNKKLLTGIFENSRDKKIIIIGDLMLDRYLFGDVTRISPEAPVQVFDIRKSEFRLGGAANVAYNIKTLGSEPFLIGITGEDSESDLLKNSMQDLGIDTEGIIPEKDRPTTSKSRVISDSHHLLRIDSESKDDISDNSQTKILSLLSEHAEKDSIVILQDYNKGVLTENVIGKIISLCKKHNILSAVDPKRKNFFAYKGVDIFKPNFKEVKDGLNILTDSINLSVLKDMHLLLQDKLNHKISLITLSEKGVFYQQDNNAGILPTHIRSIADVSGAGDTVIAVASVVFAATGDAKLMAEVANIAGGLVCEAVGTVAVEKSRLMDECKKLLT